MARRPARKPPVESLRDDLGHSFREGSGGYVAFSVRGNHYRIRLSNRNYQRLLNILAPYMAAGRRIEPF